jgi:putative ATP-dependent endonuclease of OLD family
MKIRHIFVRGFRGINNLDWGLPENSIYCLIGPGNSTKSTILDAIEWALTPRWNMPIFDTDFHKGNIDSPIDIRITVGGLPDALLSLDKFGYHTRGWKNNQLTDEPTEGSEEVITIQLLIDHSLEPIWTLFTERNEKPRPISGRERESLGMIRLGPYVDRQLSWGYGSALTRLTDDLDNIPSILADASRSARNKIDNTKLPKLKEAADQAYRLGIDFGVNPRGEYNPALDPASANESVGAITLFEGGVPTRQSGLGSKRLLTLALQQNCVKEGSIQLIDEVEQGLEPHRVRHLLHVLDTRLNKNPGDNKCQIFMTTHSRDVIEELTAKDIFIVRSDNGVTEIKQVNLELQNTIRAESIALLARKIIVCEGKTELGICKALNRNWANEKEGKPFAHLGVVPVDGNGSNATKHTLHLRTLGYDVCYFADADRDDLNPDIETLGKSGIKVILWAEKNCTEQRLCSDLPWKTLQLFVNLAIEIKGEQAILSATAAKLKCLPAQITQSVDDWLKAGFTQEVIRGSLSQAAKSGGWFKMIDPGELLGNLVYSCLAEIKGTDTEVKLGQLKEWVYA